MTENKEVMASNIKYYMELNKVNATEICKALGFKQNTFSDWVNAKTYPRIDNIEKMANFFGVSKANLVEKPLTSPDEYELAWHQRGGGRHPITLTDEEYEMVLEYRISSDDDKRMIKRILSYATALKKGGD